MGAVFTGIIIFLLLGFLVVGCRPDPEDLDTGVEEDQEVFIQAEGVYVGQIDSHTVEIEVEDQAKAFGLAEGLDVSGIAEGSKVAINYENRAERPVLQSIEVVYEPAEELFQAEGFYVGRIDSRSVEIEVEGDHRVFVVARENVVEDLLDGSRIAFTYREDDPRPVLIDVEVIEEPDVAEANDKQQIEGEGVFVGQIDSQSIEVVRNRAFGFAEGVDVEVITEGAKVAFTYIETGDRPIIEYLEAVDSPPEGEIMTGIFVGQIDSHSVEIEYEQAFTLGEGLNVEGIDAGSDLFFIYREGPSRPVIQSISAR